MRLKFIFAGLAAVLLFGAVLAVPIAHAASLFQARQVRPIALGTSGGNINDFSRGGNFCSGGTLGSLVQDANGAQHVLSNNHVLARENKAMLGEDITQPGLIDVGCQRIASDVVADLSGFVPIQFGKKGTNTVDAAIAQARPGAVRPDGSILSIGTVSNLLATATAGCAVQKAGRTTGLTSGSVSAVNATVSVRYSGGTATFTNQFVVTPGTFSAGGDSGSLIVRDGLNPRPVGLLFAGSSSYTIGNPIQSVVGSLGVSMVGVGDGSMGDCPSAPAAPAVAQGSAAKEKHKDALLDLPDVVGVAVGVDGAVEVYLERENPSTRRNIPPALDNVPVRVVVTGAFEAR